MTKKIISIIKNSDLDSLIKIKKTDFHLHASRSGRYTDFVREFRTDNHTLPDCFGNFREMEEWVNCNIHPYCNSRTDWEKRIALMFLALKKDSVYIYTPSFTIRDVMRYETISNFISAIERIKMAIIPDSFFLPCLSLNRRRDPQEQLRYAERILETKWFDSIDLCNDELCGEIDPFVPIYRLATKSGLKKKAHVGEVGNAADIVRAIKLLGLDEVQHGISIVENQEAIGYARASGVMFNVCPRSNIALSIVDDYESHPIKRMFHEGLQVSINTDDSLIFGRSISEQVMALYNHGVFSAEELTIILENGLKWRHL